MSNLICKIASYIYLKSVESATYSSAPDITIDEVENYFDIKINRKIYQEIVDTIRDDYDNFLLDVNDNCDDYCFENGVFSLNIGTQYCYNYCYNYNDEEDSWLEEKI